MTWDWGPCVEKSCWLGWNVKSFCCLEFPLPSGFPWVSQKIGAWWVAGKEPYWLWLLPSPSTCDNVPVLGEGGEKNSPQMKRIMVVYSCRAPERMIVPVCSYSTWGSGWGGGEATKFCTDGSVLVLQKMRVLHCPQCMLLNGARHHSPSPCMTTSASIEVVGYFLCGKNCYAKEYEHVESKWQNI